jgi:cytochrome c oxidase subunit 4
MSTETHGSSTTAHHDDAAGHATVKTYVMIGAILTIVTAAEVAIFYIEALAPVLVPALLIMSAGKFLLVVYFYMHLKYDNPIFSRVFFGPMLLAVMFVAVSLVILFKYLPQFDMYAR